MLQDVTALIQDVVLQNKHLDTGDATNFSTSSDQNIPLKNSPDMKNNERGRKLIDLRIMSEFDIVNGWKVGDLPGKRTCFRWNESSQIAMLILIFLKLGYNTLKLMN